MRLRMVSHHASTHFCRPKYYKSEVEGHPRPSCLVESRLWEIIARKRSRAPIVRVVAHSENGHLSSFRSAITPVKSLALYRECLRRRSVRALWIVDHRRHSRSDDLY
jgi:hypothetical protein